MKQLTPERRDLMLKVIDNHPLVCPIMFHWNKRDGVDVVLRYLIAKKMTGQALLNWINGLYAGRFQEAFDYLLTKIKSNPPLIIVR